VNIVPFTRLFYVHHFFFTTSMGGMWRGFPLLSHLQARGPKWSFICFGPLSNSPRDHHMAPNCVFPSLTDDIHSISEITCAFGHLSTQLALVGLRVKVSKCKLWSPFEIFLGIEIF